MSDSVEHRVIEWPQSGSAKRWIPSSPDTHWVKGRPGAGPGWFYVEYRAGCGYTPIAGPFKTKHEAEAAMQKVAE